MEAKDMCDPENLKQKSAVSNKNNRYSVLYQSYNGAEEKHNMLLFIKRWVPDCDVISKASSPLSFLSHVLGSSSMS